MIRPKNKNGELETVNSHVVATMDRRMFLRSTLGAWFAIPFLPSLLMRPMEAFAATGPTGSTPTSAFLFFSMNGFTHHRLFRFDPSLTSQMVQHTNGPRVLDLDKVKNDNIGSALNYLKPYFSDLNINIGSSWSSDDDRLGEGAGHDGLHKALTGYAQLNQANAKSMDGYIATKFKSDPITRPSKFDIVDYTNIFNGSPNPPLGTGFSKLRMLRSQGGASSLTQLHSALFGGIYPSGPDADRHKANRNTVLDALSESYKAVSSSLSASNRISLDAHIDGLTEIHKQNNTIYNCTIPSGMPYPAPDVVYDQDQFPLAQYVNQLSVAALACGLSRTFIYNMGPYTQAWHGSSHMPNDIGADWMVNGLVNGPFKTMADLAGLLKARINPITGKDLFSETTMSLQNEYGSPGCGGLFGNYYCNPNHEHSLHGNTMLLLGGANGRVQNGVLVDWFDNIGYFKGAPGTWENTGTLNYSGYTLGLCAQQQVQTTYLRGVFDIPDSEIFINDNFGNMGQKTGDYPVPDSSTVFGRKRTDMLPFLIKSA
jgi:Protein of unknown function (DUF1552)